MNQYWYVLQKVTKRVDNMVIEIYVSIGEDDKKINDMVIEDNVSTIESKTRIDQ